VAEVEIAYKLDLILRLVDTTTGRAIPEKQTAFLENGCIVPFLERDTGVYILLNRGRADTRFQVEVKGFMPREVSVCYSRLSEQFPEMEVPMIPQVRAHGFVDLLTLEGCLPGLEQLSAISLSAPVASVAGYVEKKQILRLFSAKGMEEQCYALLHREQMEYEEFCIEKRVDKFALRLREPLQAPCKPEEWVARIVQGMVDAAGRYMLRVREDGKGTEYLVRSVVQGKTSFRKIRFAKPEERRL